MRVILILMTISALISNLIGVVQYNQVINQEGATVLQQIAALLDVGLSSVALIVGVAGLAIVQAVRNLATSSDGTPASKARWWQDKNNPG